MREQEPQGPDYPIPWYFRPEYMLPMLVFWPAGSLLVLRSPWNKNTMLGGVAWAFIIVGGVLGFIWVKGGEYQPLTTFYVPGALLTMVTQVQWKKRRAEMAGQEMALGEEPSREPSREPMGESKPPDRPRRPTARRRRRNSRTGRSKS